MFATIFFKRKDGKPISKAQSKDAETEAAELQAIMVQDYADILSASKGLWTHEIDGSFEQLAQIKKPLELRPDGSLSFCFEIRSSPDDCCGVSWRPRKLCEALGLEDEYCELKKDGTLDEEFLARLKRKSVKS